MSNENIVNPWDYECYSNFTKTSFYLYCAIDAIESTANQNTWKPLYTWQYYTRPACALRVCRIDCAGHGIFYGIK